MVRYLYLHAIPTHNLNRSDLVQHPRPTECFHGPHIQNYIRFANEMPETTMSHYANANVALLAPLDVNGVRAFWGSG